MSPMSIEGVHNPSGVRSDAHSNRLAILRATRDICGERGEDFSVKEIAATAQVSVATVYRHFDGKQALMDDVSLSRWRHMISLATVPGRYDRITRIIGVLDVYSRVCTADSAFLHALNLRPGFGHLAEQMRLVFDPRFDELWRHAQAMGEIRPGVSSVDMVNLTSGIQDQTRRHSMLALLLSGALHPDIQADQILQQFPGGPKRESENQMFSVA